jgi:hypothetical protein
MAISADFLVAMDTLTIAGIILVAVGTALSHLARSLGLESVTNPALTQPAALLT